MFISHLNGLKSSSVAILLYTFVVLKMVSPLFIPSTLNPAASAVVDVLTFTLTTTSTPTFAQRFVLGEAEQALATLVPEHPQRLLH